MTTAVQSQGEEMKTQPEKYNPSTAEILHLIP